jgi:hypothetical protein
MHRRFAQQATRLLGALATMGALGAVPALTSGCSQTPVVVPVRSMERPKDVDLICLQHTADDHWRGAPLEKCAVDDAANSVETDAEYRLHAVVTQMSRGELAVVDLARSPLDTTSTLVKVDPRTPGYSFLPVGAVPIDVAADPGGEAVYVASGRDPRVDIIPAGMLRGPIDSNDESGGALPWSKIDFDPTTDGLPGALTVVRDDPTDPAAGGYGKCSPTDTTSRCHAGATCDVDRCSDLPARLFVSLPDAMNGTVNTLKIAVFDLRKGALAPTRLADVKLESLSNVPHASLTKTTCATDNGAPWWLTYEKCFGGSTLPVPKEATQAAFTRMHLAGIAVAGGKLFAADDTAPFVHVFDLASGKEERRIGVGTPTARVSVSEPVPDEVNAKNARAIEVCERLGWLGDGLDHTLDFKLIGLKDSAGKDLPDRYGDVINGRCNAHRYVYAVDLVDAQAGDGSLTVLDIPVKLVRLANEKTVRDTGVPAPVEREELDVAGTEMSQPLSCDSPAFPARRVPLSNSGVGLGLGNNAPVRSVSFIKRDYASSALSRKELRSVPWPRGAASVPGRPSLVAEFGDAVTDPTWFTNAKVDLVRADEATWASTAVTAGPKQLRGVFAFAALANGAVLVLDVDDYDRLVRGSKTTLAASAGGVPTSAIMATDEINDQVVERHHPRLARLYSSDSQTVINVNLSLLGTSLSTDLKSDAGRTHPHLVPLKDPTGVGISTLIAVSAKSPFPLVSENWSMTYEGVLPGYAGAAGTITGDGAAAELLDPAGHFCRRGVETSTTPDANDVVQIIDAVCPDGACTEPGVKQSCLDYYGLDATTLANNQIAAGSATTIPLEPTRDLLIGTAFEDHVTITKHAQVDGSGNVSWAPGLDTAGKPTLKTCFPGLTRYVVRAHNSWVVQGSTTGYLHRRIPSRADDPTAQCVTDTTLPRVFQGRAWELPALGKNETADTMDTQTDLCSVSASGVPIFANPAIKFAIRSGTQRSVRDMLFLFGLRVLTSPLAIASVTLPTATRPLARWVNGVDTLNWQQLALVDGIDRGLGIYSYDFATSKTFP